MAEEVVQHTLASSRTIIETDNTPVTKVFKTGKPIAYTASEAVYVDGTLFKTGEVFVTDKPKGSSWEAVNPLDRLTHDAGEPSRGDVDLDAMDVPALKAFAATNSINLGDASRKSDIITVIKAARTQTF